MTIILSASDNAIQDSLTSNQQDSIQNTKSQPSEKLNISKWIEEHPVMLGLIGAILAAFIGGWYVMKAKNKELKQKLALAEKEKETAVQEA